MARSGVGKGSAHAEKESDSFEQTDCRHAVPKKQTLLWRFLRGSSRLIPNLLKKKARWRE